MLTEHIESGNIPCCRTGECIVAANRDYLLLVSMVVVLGLMEYPKPLIRPAAELKNNAAREVDVENDSLSMFFNIS